MVVGLLSILYSTNDMSWMFTYWDNIPDITIPTDHDFWIFILSIYRFVFHTEDLDDHVRVDGAGGGYICDSNLIRA